MDVQKHEEAQKIPDEFLGQVFGGKKHFEINGRYFEYTGSILCWSSDWDHCYLCPRCGRPVHYGKWARFYCDPCDESWYWEEKLVPNLASGLWKELTKEEYDEPVFPDEPM